MPRSSDLSRESLLFLRDILLRQSLAVSAPDFTATAAIITRALAELDEAIAAAEPQATNSVPPLISQARG